MCKVITYGQKLSRYLPSKLSVAFSLTSHAQTLTVILKVKTSRHMCIERRAILQFSVSLHPKEPGLKKIKYPDL